jgi:carbonic anhydrase
MRLFEAIIDANHRAVAGDADAGVPVAEFAYELPVIALTCIDPRLNALFPNVLGIPADQFIWLRNAGNIITGPLTSTMRSLALACAVKEGREIAIIGHTDCHVRQTTALQLLEKLKHLGVDRAELPENLNEFFGMFASERQNVIKSCGFARQSPLIGPKIPVHGLLVDILTGKLEWIVNGYEVWRTVSKTTELGAGQATAQAIGSLGGMAKFDPGEMKFPDLKIGDAGGQKGLGEIKPLVTNPPPPAPRPAVPPVIPAAPVNGPLSPSEWVRPGIPKKPLPPPIRPRFGSRDQPR